MSIPDGVRATASSPSPLVGVPAGRAGGSVALIVPHTNTVMRPDLDRMSHGALDITTWRIRLDTVTREAEERMLGAELDERLDQIAPTAPEVVVFGCTSAGALGGLAHDGRVAERIRRAVGGEVVTVVGSMVEELARLAPPRVAVFTPYAAELTGSVAACVAEAGYEVTEARGVGLVDNEEIGRMPPDAIVDFVEEGMKGARADAVFLSCTNWRAAEAIGALGDALGVPVLSSNQVTHAALQRRIAG